jgi:hypothetical protein
MEYLTLYLDTMKRNGRGLAENQIRAQKPEDFDSTSQHLLTAT